MSFPPPRCCAPRATMQAPPSPERGPTYTATTRGTDRSPLSTPLCFYRANHSNPNTVIHVTAHAHTPFELPAIPHFCSSAKRIAKPMADAISQECVVMMRTTCGKHPATPFPDPQGADPITDAANLVAILPALTTQGPALAVNAVLACRYPPFESSPPFCPAARSLAHNWALESAASQMRMRSPTIPLHRSILSCILPSCMIFRSFHPSSPR